MGARDGGGVHAAGPHAAPTPFTQAGSHRKGSPSVTGGAFALAWATHAASDARRGATTGPRVKSVQLCWQASAGTACHALTGTCASGSPSTTLFPLAPALDRYRASRARCCDGAIQWKQSTNPALHVALRCTPQRRLHHRADGTAASQVCRSLLSRCKRGAALGGAQQAGELGACWRLHDWGSHTQQGTAQRSCLVCGLVGCYIWAVTP